MGLLDWEEDEEPSKRALTIRERKILYTRASGKCQLCGEPINFLEMQVGHKIAASRGGSATLRNTVALCFKCNNLQGTDSWERIHKKLDKETPEMKMKDILNGLTVRQLAFLAKSRGVKVKGRYEEEDGILGESYYLAPSKRMYVNRLLEKLKGTPEETIRAELAKMPKAKRRRSSNDDDDWF